MMAEPRSVEGRMKIFVVSAVLVLAALHSMPANAVTICGQEVPAPADSNVLIGYWQRADGTQVCAGLVAGRTRETTAEYVYGRGTHLHLTGEYDGATYTLRDEQGSTFTFRADGSANFVGGSGHLVGRFTPTRSGVATAATPHSFEEFPVYRGPPQMPDFQGRDRQFRDFRTRLRNGIREGPNFGGRYKVIQFGCGTGCSVVLVADVSTGQVYSFPHGGEGDQQLQLEYRISSNLIRSWWVPNIEDMGRCLHEGFIFEDQHFTSLGKPTDTSCPAGYCENGVCEHLATSLAPQTAPSSAPAVVQATRPEGASSASAPPAPAPSPIIGDRQQAIKDHQQALIDAVEDARQRYRTAANDMARGGTRAWRKDVICKLLPSLTVKDWKGEIYKLSSNSDGKGVVEITIGRDTYVKTWNNSLSDIGDHTLIEPNSAIFRTLSQMKEGDRIRFSGSFIGSDTDCVKEASMTQNGSMTEPEFIFRFLGVSPE
jgi:hypothetical protein